MILLFPRRYSFEDSPPISFLFPPAPLLLPLIPPTPAAMISPPIFADCQSRYAGTPLSPLAMIADYQPCLYFHRDIN